MTIDFIFFGTLFLLMIFGFFKCNNKIAGRCFILISIMIVLGYLLPKVNGNFITFNFFHLITFLFMLVIFQIYFRPNVLYSILVGCFYFILISINKNFMLTYDLTLCSILSIVPVLIHLKNVYYSLGEFVDNIFLIFIINSLFEFDEFNYIVLDFSIAFKLMTILCLILIVYKCINSLFINERRFVRYEKNTFVFAFNFDS